MKVFGKPQFLLLYYKYYHPLLNGIDTDKAFLNLKINLVLPEEMPEGSVNSSRPHYNSRIHEIYLPIVEMPDVSYDLYFRSMVFIYGHELGHAVHFKYLPNEKVSDPGWQEFSRLSGKPLDFERKTYSSITSKEYPHVPSQENFANEFSRWLTGERLHMEAFFMGLWGQEAKVKPAYIPIFKAIYNFTGASGKQALKNHLEIHNPRALVYLK